MSNRKIWHILVTSNSSSGVRSIRFSKLSATITFIFISLFLILCGIMTYLYINNKLDQEKMIRLNEHNIQLKNEMTKINALLDTMKFKLENLQDRDKAVRKLESMRPIDNDIRQMGIGGIQYIDSTFYTFDEDLFNLHNKLLDKMDLFNRQIDFEISSYNEITKFLTVKNTIFNHTPSVRPAKGRISDVYGWRIHPVTKIHHFHHGVDIANTLGTFIYATADGKVRETGYDKDYGRYILIDHGYGYTTYYAHLSKQLVERGDSVTKYMIIGQMGNSGCSTGTHLHYEVRFYGRTKNPLNYFNKKKSTIFVDRKYLS
ncbi:MAG: M23 family metallopeptidase [Candidatus Cloacimonetes bacterium]|nr:M23 family metallopeptidase [Candidatus Cloacimonadota bacterium]